MRPSPNKSGKQALLQQAAGNRRYDAGGLHAISAFFANYVNFTGRSDRREFWYWTLWNWLLSLLVAVPLFGSVIWMTFRSSASSGLGVNAAESAAFHPFGAGVVPLLILILLAGLWGIGTLLPSLALGVRRFRDAGISWVWYVVLTAVPVVLLLIADAAVIISLLNRPGENSGASGLSLAAMIAAIFCGIALLVIDLLPSKPLHLADGSVSTNGGVQLKAAPSEDTGTVSGSDNDDDE